MRYIVKSKKNGLVVASYDKLTDPIAIAVKPVLEAAPDNYEVIDRLSPESFFETLTLYHYDYMADSEDGWNNFSAMDKLRSDFVRFETNGATKILFEYQISLIED